MPNTHTTLASLFTAIANAIRTKKGTSAEIVADNFPEEIASIPTGEDPVLITKTITANGTYNASDDNADGYSGVNVNVSNLFEDYFVSYPYPFNGAILPNNITLNLKNATSMRDVLRNAVPSVAQGSEATVICDNSVTSCQCMLRDCRFETVNMNFDTSHVTSAIDFSRGATTKYINGIFDASSLTSLHINFISDHVVEFRVKPNTLAKTAQSNWDWGYVTSISKDTLISLINGLNEINIGTISRMGGRYDAASQIYGISSEVEDYHVFVETGNSNDMTLLSFMTTVKGWTATK